MPANATPKKPAKAAPPSREQLRAMTERERQEYYLSRLPADYKFPLFNGRRAVESQRASNYRTTARAAREIVDNALEAGAKNIRIIFDQTDKGKKVVTAVAFIDDGPGMSPMMARYALTWGGGTHSDDPHYIGKFGFGLPNASINQTKRFNVYTRTSAEEAWSVVGLNVDDVGEYGEVNAPEAEETELPEFVQDYLERNDIELGSGTVVVWNQPDRLTYKTVSNLKDHLLDDFGVTYRYMLPRSEVDAVSKRPKILAPGKVQIFVEEKAVEPIDPMFLMPGARLYLPPNKEDPEKGGAWETFGQGKTDGRVFAVKYFRDAETQADKLELLRTEEQLEAAKEAVVKGEAKAIGYIQVRISRMPVGFAEGGIHHKKNKTIAWQRFEVRLQRRGISFVRSDREIETLDVFPRSAHDVASGLGEWPRLSSYAYHYPVEIRFDTELDEAFGVGHDKQTLRPCDDFWRIMASDGVELNKAIRVEEGYQKEKRDRKQRKDKDPSITDPSKTAAVTNAADAASRALGEPRKVAEYRADEAKRLFEEAVKKRAELNKESLEIARKAIEDEAKRKPFAIEFFESDGGVFFKPGLGNGAQRVAMINKLHPFYQYFYSAIAELGVPIARQTVDLLLLTLANAELNADEDVADMYDIQRESKWSPFLKHGLKRLAEMEHQSDEEEPEE